VRESSVISGNFFAHREKTFEKRGKERRERKGKGREKRGEILLRLKRP
jgi:hypothetical protein